MSVKESSNRSFKETKLHPNTEERIADNLESKKLQKKELLQKNRSKQRLL